MKHTTQKKISFCITCMNRLHHLQKTLKQNIEDNYQPSDVEFVLLDYNSSDGLDNWIYAEMQEYINMGILIYYKTFQPSQYDRSHSRNIVFKLSKGDILCNLDADNYLGKGFANEMIENFSRERNIFYTSDLSFSDIFGRVVVSREDFHAIRGYNESFIGYGHEDVDLFNRLINNGLTQNHFNNPTFYNVIKHSKKERIENDFFTNNLRFIYISYINPHSSEILILYKNFKYNNCILIDDKQLSSFISPIINNVSDQLADSITLIRLKEPILEDFYKESDSQISFNLKGNEVFYDKVDFSFRIKNQMFYKIEDVDFIINIYLLLSKAQNILMSEKDMNENKATNSDGYGQGIIFKNFDLNNPIKLI